MLDRFDDELRIRQVMTDPRIRWERDGCVVRIVSPYTVSHMNGVIYSRGADDATIDAQTAYFTKLGKNFEWKFYGHDEPRDLASRLQSRGFTPEPEEAVMVCDLETTKFAAPDVEIIPVTDRPAIKEVVRLNELVWKKDLAWLEDNLAVEKPDIYAARCDGRIVCAGWIRCVETFAMLFGGTTHPDYRLRGIYKAVVAKRAALARSRGVRWLAVEASPMSRPILERTGFKFVSTLTAWSWNNR